MEEVIAGRQPVLPGLELLINRLEHVAGQAQAGFHHSGYRIPVFLTLAGALQHQFDFVEVLDINVGMRNEEGQLRGFERQRFTQAINEGSDELVGVFCPITITKPL